MMASSNAHCIFHSFTFAVTYRRDRSIREVYDERFLTERPVRVCFDHENIVLLFHKSHFVVLYSSVMSDSVVSKLKTAKVQ